MKKKSKTYLKFGLGSFLLLGLIVSISPTFSIFNKKDADVSIDITYTPSGADVITYKLVANKTIYLDTTYTVGKVSNSGQLTCGEGATEFDLSLIGGVYKTSWTNNTETIYCPSATTFTWKKYVNGAFNSNIGTASVSYEGVYTISPTYDGNTTVSLGKTVEKRAIYLIPNSDWKKDGAWFTLYYWPNDDWICGADMGNSYYRFFVDTNVTGFKFNRMCPSTNSNYNSNYNGFNWDNRWNDSGNKEFDGTNNCFTITGWDNSGTWGTYNG